MGIIGKTGTRQTRHTASYWCPHASELGVLEESVGSPPNTLPNPYKSEFLSFCRAGS